MQVQDLNREQLIELKQRYLSKLSNESVYAEVMGVDYNEPSYYDIANADNIVSDDVIFREYEGVEFMEEDF